MYVVDGYGAVYKIDVRDPPRPRSRGSWIRVSQGRGVDTLEPRRDLYKNFVISVTGERQGACGPTRDTGEMVKKRPGRRSNERLFADLGSAGHRRQADRRRQRWRRGARAHIDALNADTGQPLWRTYTVPAPGEPGSETWKDKNNAWKHGGGSYWQTGSYDPTTNLTIWGTGQPVPMFDPEYRPGDNLFTNATVGFDVNTGKMKWYFQYTRATSSTTTRLASTS